MNPVLKGLYADPDVIYSKGKYYMYPTTDGFDGWSGWQFHAFSSENLVDWKDEGIILDLNKDVAWATGSAWAPCMAEKDGKYYYYFCGKCAEGDSCIGLAVSDYPDREFVAEDEPLICLEDVKKHGMEGMCQTIDPSIYKEDGKYYLLFGNGAAAIVELEEDMRHVKWDTMKKIEGLKDFRESVILMKKDDKYHFTWSCEDTGSENYHVKYGVSHSISGPVEYKYPVLEKRPEEDILGTGHHCIFSSEDEWMMAYHRFATPTQNYPEGKGYHRETCIDKIQFDEQGYMKKIIVTT